MSGRLLAPVTAAVLALAGVAEVLTTSDWSGPRAAALAFAVLIPAPLALARTRPLTAGLAVCAAIAATALSLRSPQSLLVILVLLIAGFVLGGAHSPRRWLAATAVPVTAVIAIACSRLGAAPPSAIAFVFAVLLYTGPVAAGAVVRARSDAVRAARAEAERAEEAQRTAAALAVADERERIAQELRDVVTGAVDSIVAAATAGRADVADRPDDAGAAFDTIERAGQRALEEMRRLLGVLRAVPELAPQPRLADLEQLLGAVAAQGVRAAVRIEGDPRRLPDAVELSAYRLIESALTDATLRLGPGEVEVVLEQRDDGLLIRISSDRREWFATDDDGLARLEALRERAALGGGRLSATADPAGYRIEALMPVGRP